MEGVGSRSDAEEDKWNGQEPDMAFVHPESPKKPSSMIMSACNLL